MLVSFPSCQSNKYGLDISYSGENCLI